jgi:hypothetical protein
MSCNKKRVEKNMKELETKEFAALDTLHQVHRLFAKRKKRLGEVAK